MAKKQNKNHHVLTVRLPMDDFEHLKRAQARLHRNDRRWVPYTEIIVNQIRKLTT